MTSEVFKYSPHVVFTSILERDSPSTYVFKKIVCVARIFFRIELFVFLYISKVIHNFNDVRVNR